MDLTSILRSYWSDPSSRNRFHEAAHEELRRLAERCLRSVGPNQTLDTQGLIGEAYLHVFGGAEVQWQNRVHFYSFMYRTMKNILIDQHRRRVAVKRGGGVQSVALNEDDRVVDSLPETILILDLLEELSRKSELTARVAGMVICEQRSPDEIARLLREHDGLDVSEREIVKHWRFAEATIKTSLNRVRSNPPSLP